MQINIVKAKHKTEENYFLYLLDGKRQPEAKSTAILFLHLLALKIVSTDFSDILS